MLTKINAQIAQLAKRREELAALLTKGGYELSSAAQPDSTIFSLDPQKTLRELKVASIMDPFTRDSFKPECDLLELTPDGWETELRTFKPDLVFVESAWEGKDKLWYREVSHCKERFFSMATWCREHNLPIIYWGKEDPVWTDVFLPAASLADVVFTTEIDCVNRYKTALGHDRVYHLHFAAQPAIHNPIEKYERKDKFCFAGAYYHRYEQRCQVFDAFASEFMAGKGLDIYDRGYPNPRPEHAFPKQYDPCILGRLESDEIDLAYKGYLFSVNMNSVTQNQTMFARRVFELLASNTVTVGNYARGLKNYFGDLTICTDDAETLKKGLDTWCADTQTLHKYRLAGLRKALSAHLYEDRLAYIVEKVFGANLAWRHPAIIVAAVVENQEEANHIQTCFERQAYPAKNLVLVTGADIDVPGAKCLSHAEAEHMTLADLGDGGWLAIFSPQDYYGEHYLLDMALLTRCGRFDAIGKSAYFHMSEGEAVLENAEGAYRFQNTLAPRRSIIARQAAGDHPLESLLTNSEVSLPQMLGADEFNYCEGSREAVDAAQDLVIADTGIPLEVINQAAVNVRPSAADFTGETVTADDLVKKSRLPASGLLKMEMDQGQALLTSNLPAGIHEYFFLSDFIPIGGLLSDGKLPITFEGAGSLDLVCVCGFYDSSRKKLDSLFPKLNRSEKLDPPKGSVYVQLGFRPKGSGICRLRGVRLAESASGGSGCFLSRSNVLVLTNQYPELPDKLYKNMFVHKRAEAYKLDGYLCDVMAMNIYAQNRYREFDGIEVVEGRAEKLSQLLEDGLIDTVCVHFLDEHMWSVLKSHLGKLKIIIWLHGVDIQPWWRRKYNFTTDAELAQGKDASDARMALWREIFDIYEKHDISFVFVSQYLLQTIVEDYSVNIAPERLQIIHNCIDTDFFRYIPKTADQRTKILSIRPYGNHNYANDLTTKAIQELAGTKEFKNLEFTIVGDGILFNETNAPLRKYKNVRLHQGFLTQEQIAAEHKGAGIFLVPTRMDTQGVSRDEAMASGLVPITSAVTAVPEFVDENSGILVPAEDYKAIADSILKLYNDPTLFERLSAGAAARVRRQSGKAQTIEKEIKLIFSETESASVQ